MLTGWGLDVEEQHCMSALWPLLLLGQHSGIYMMRLLAWFIAWLIVPMIALCIKGTRSVTQLGSDRAESALCKYVCDRRCDMSCNWSLWWSHTHSTRRTNTVMIVLCNHIWLLRPFILCPTQWLWVGHCDGHWWNVVGGLLCDGVGGGLSACLDVGSLGTAAGFSASRLWCKVALHGPHTMMVSWKGVGKVSSDPSRTSLVLRSQHYPTCTCRRVCKHSYVMSAYTGTNDLLISNTNSIVNYEEPVISYEKSWVSNSIPSYSSASALLRFSEHHRELAREACLRQLSYGDRLQWYMTRYTTVDTVHLDKVSKLMYCLIMVYRSEISVVGG